MLIVEEHASLDLRAVILRWPQPLGAMAAPAWLDALTSPDAETPFATPSAEQWEHERSAVRDLLRHGGFKPSGRSKPCSEYMRAVATKGAFPRINVAVDLTNAAVLHGRLPISTVDLDLLSAPLRVGIAPAGARYVFNPSGQEIDVSGLLCLFDDDGPCANAVKDSQRAKTSATTTTTVTVIWGTKALPERSGQVLDHLTTLAMRAGAAIEPVDTDS